MSGRVPEGRACLSRLQPHSVSLGAICGAKRLDEATKGRLRLTLEKGSQDQKTKGLESGGSAFEECPRSEAVGE